ncbi:HutD family protein [Alphaproteobacteria bacterium]|nr:HutD family protein [Alphaproteobacteria bacterium]
MKITHLTETDYQIKPWKNGKGTTADLFMSPEGATHDTFDLRFSMAPIVEDGPFSSFPSADRRITLIEGNGLNLDFGDRSHDLMALKPFGFDTELAPMGSQLDGPVRVVNVMARRPKWQIAECRVVDQISTELKDGEFCFVFALSGDWSGSGGMTVGSREVLLAEDAGKLELNSSTSAQAIFAKIIPA